MMLLRHVIAVGVHVEGSESPTVVPLPLLGLASTKVGFLFSNLRCRCLRGQYLLETNLEVLRWLSTSGGTARRSWWVSGV